MRRGVAPNIRVSSGSSADMVNADRSANEAQAPAAPIRTFRHDLEPPRGRTVPAPGHGGRASRGNNTRMRVPRLSRLIAALAAPALLASGVVAAAGPAQAVTTMSTKYIVNTLPAGVEHAAGYDRGKFTLWSDADGDGCDARDEVLIKEAITKPRVGSGCALRGGRWFSKYDGVRTTDSSSFDIDHMVPLNEAWQSGAWAWSSAKRKAYANDLGYKASLIAVSAHSNRSKGDREPQDWMPERVAYSCKYVKQWVAVKWRWQLKVNTAERSFLRDELKSCGWPRVPKPGKPVIPSSGGSGGGTGGGGTGGGGGADPRYSYCYEVVAAGLGPYYRGVDPEYDWYTDSDSDGVVCES